MTAHVYTRPLSRACCFFKVVHTRAAAHSAFFAGVYLLDCSYTSYDRRVDCQTEVGAQYGPLRTVGPDEVSCVEVGRLEMRTLMMDENVRACGSARHAVQI